MRSFMAPSLGHKEVQQQDINSILAQNVLLRSALIDQEAQLVSYDTALREVAQALAANTDIWGDDSEISSYRWPPALEGPSREDKDYIPVDVVSRFQVGLLCVLS